MKPFTRSAQPPFLAPHWQRWGEEWETRRATNPKARFQWHQIDGWSLNILLLPPLKQLTQDHCSFCDMFPVSPPSVETIEHFRPKTAFPRLAYKWENLYFTCAHCQQKGSTFDEALLCPDAPDYSFDRYFLWDYTKGLLMVNPNATPEDKRRAALTIDTYRLNAGHPSLRRRELRRRAKLKTDPLDDFAYRNFVH